jgi:hypothetical protein
MRTPHLIPRLAVAATSLLLACGSTEGSRAPADHTEGKVTVRSYVGRNGSTHYYAASPPLADGQAGTFLHPDTDERGAVLLGTPTPSPYGFGASEIESAYGVPLSSSGPPPIVAVVIFGDDPQAENDLGVYRKQYGLPPCTTANGCFQKIVMNNPTPAVDSAPGSAGELANDIEMVSATCPSCYIVLVESAGSNAAAMMPAFTAAIQAGAQYITNSWGFREWPGDTAYELPFANWSTQGISFFAGTGDWGWENVELPGPGGPQLYWPSVSASVTAVGGTTLTPNMYSTAYSQGVWAGTGAGCSTTIPLPNWQPETQWCGAARTVNDVSALANGVDVYDSQSSGGWITLSGTSVSGPLVAGLYATNRWRGATPAFAYQNTSLFSDVTTGDDCNSDSVEGPAPWCSANAGYDLPTGNGSPNGPSPDVLQIIDAPLVGGTPQVTIPWNGYGSVYVAWGGSWVSADGGEGATIGWSIDLGSAPDVISAQTAEGMTLQISPPGLAYAGKLYAGESIWVTDAASGITHSVLLDIYVSPCVPVTCSAGQCGTIASTNGCGGTTPVVCPACGNEEVCSDNVCCPTNTYWSASLQQCVASCKFPYAWCPALEECATVAACKHAGG